MYRPMFLGGHKPAFYGPGSNRCSARNLQSSNLIHRDSLRAPRGRSQHPPAARAGVPVRFKEDAVSLETEEEFIKLPYDYTELLGLHGRDSYLFCDITRAYDDLLNSPAEEGYSEDVLMGRRELLEMLKEGAIKQDGRFNQENGGIDIPISLLPSAMVHMAQVGYDDVVIDMVSTLLENWEFRKMFKQDLIMALAVAYCNKARELLKDDQTAQGCLVLEEAAYVLQNSDNPSVGSKLISEIKEGLHTLRVPRILDQLRGPTSEELLPARRRTVQMLRGLLQEQAAGRVSEEEEGGINADYIQLVVGSLTSSEMVEMADWDDVLRNLKSLPWIYPGLLEVAAAAHIVDGFLNRNPAKVFGCLRLLKALPASADAAVLKGVTWVLLGSTDKAVEAFQEAARAPADAGNTWYLESTSSSGSSTVGDDDEEPLQPRYNMRLPSSNEAFAFICAHSPEEDGDLLPGLCLFTELWIAKVGFAQFRDTAQQPVSASISSYFSSQRVQVQLENVEQLEQQAAAAGASGKDMLEGALQTVSSKVQQLAEVGRQLSQQLRQGGTSSGSQRLAADMGLMGVQAEGGAGAAPARALANRAGQLLQQATAAVADQLAEAGPRGKLGLAAGAAGALLVAAVVGSRLGAGRPAAGQVQAAAGTQAAAVLPSGRQMSTGSALRLIQQFQKAKARALGSEFDCSQLGSVLMGQALSHYTNMAHDSAARGWFRTSRLWKCEVQSVRPLTASGQRVNVLATIGESAETYGIDGQNHSSWSNEYDVDYEMTLCKDGAWRISHVKVRGKEPGLKGFGIPFGGWGGK